MRILNYLLQCLLDGLLWLADRFSWRRLKLWVYYCVLFLSYLWQEILYWYQLTMYFLGPDIFYEFFYILAFLFLVCLFLRLLFFLYQSRFSLNGFHRKPLNVRWVLRFLRFIFWYLVMLTLVDWYRDTPERSLFFHACLGAKRMYALEILGALTYILSFIAILIAVIS